MKIQILTMMNKRPAVSKLWARCINRFIASAPEGYECRVHVAYSEEETMDLCTFSGFESSRHPNHPIGRKLNKGLLNCLKYEWDYLLIMGDDDFLLPEAWNYYKEAMEAGFPYFGFGDILFYSPQAGKARHFDYADSGSRQKLMGCGRMIHRQAVEQCGWNAEIKFPKDYRHGGVEYPGGVSLTMPAYRAAYLVNLGVAEATNGEPFFEMWNEKLQRGLDNDSEIRLLFNGHPPYCIPTDKPMMLDLKAEANLWHFAHFVGISKTVPEADALAFFTESEQAYIKEQWPTTGEGSLPERRFYIGIRDAQQIFNEEVEKIVREEYARLKGAHLFSIRACTILNFNDHPGYIEVHHNHGKKDHLMICGIYTEQVNNEVILYIKQAVL